MRNQPTGVLPPKGLSETWLEYLITLLHVAAGIEHELMVQYLYAAYSLGGQQVPVEEHDLVETWRRNILAIAKEEMGHMLTVQNILALLGGPITWERGNYPWSNEYLGQSGLTPLTPQSLAFYVFAEQPRNTAGVAKRYGEIPEKDVQRIVDEVREANQDSPHHVVTLYAEIRRIIQDPALIPDRAFHSETYALQASWEEWGKGYPPPKLDPEYKPYEPGLEALMTAEDVPEARVILPQMASRNQVLTALDLLAEQGEEPHFTAEKPLGPADEQPSHFDRFLRIYYKFENIQWIPTRSVPRNPTTRPDARGAIFTEITSEHSRNWAHLFNLRYRMLLTYLSHMYRLPPATDSTQPEMRAGTLHRVFSEMYNLRSVGGILVRLPLMDEERLPNDPRAGPPFELPYTLALPVAEEDCWRLHRELLVNSKLLCQQLLRDAPVEGKKYLVDLSHLDTASIAWIDATLQAPSILRRQRP